ncbi:MAG: UPF0175 family protein [Methanocellales archaeon]|nr:UPF0175 family protein [Methanocellales archaeon]
METISTRVPKEIIEAMQEIEEIEQSDRATVVRKLLVKAIEEWEKNRAIQLYRDGKITLWRAARMANLSLREMMKLAAEKGIEFRYTEKDLEEDIKAALKG